MFRLQLSYSDRVLNQGTGKVACEYHILYAVQHFESFLHFFVNTRRRQHCVFQKVKRVFDHAKVNVFQNQVYEIAETVIGTQNYFNRFVSVAEIGQDPSCFQCLMSQ